MALTKSGFAASELAELLREHFAYRTIESEALGARSPEAFRRRVYDILNGKCQRVTLRVADDIATACGRPDWLVLLT